MSIGGYFELELSRFKEYRRNTLRLNSGLNLQTLIFKISRSSKSSTTNETHVVSTKVIQQK